MLKNLSIIMTFLMIANINGMHKLKLPYGESFFTFKNSNVSSLLLSSRTSGLSRTLSQHRNFINPITNFDKFKKPLAVAYHVGTFAGILALYSNYSTEQTNED